MNAKRSAIYLVLSSKSYLLTFLAITAISLVSYSYLLSTSSVNLAQPKIFFGLNAYAIVLSALIGILFALSVTMNAFAFLNGAASASKVGFGAALASIIPASLCCTSVIPALLAAFGASTATIIGVTGTIQGPFAAYETLFIVASAGLLLLSIFLVSKNISKCCVVKK